MIIKDLLKMSLRIEEEYVDFITRFYAKVKQKGKCDLSFSEEFIRAHSAFQTRRQAIKMLEAALINNDIVQVDLKAAGVGGEVTTEDLMSELEGETREFAEAALEDESNVDG